MPIRFRCAYCNQLMGIARRKAGNVVRCPTCAGQVIVPTPGAAEPEPPPPPAPQPVKGPSLFEQGDFDRDVLNNPTAGARAPRRNGPGSSPSHPARPSRNDAIDVEPVSMPLAMGRAAQESGLHLSTAAAVGLGLVVVLLMGLAFFAGLVLGKAAGGA